jgi:hypothetical protein
VNEGRQEVPEREVREGRKTGGEREGRQVGHPNFILSPHPLTGYLDSHAI